MWRAAISPADDDAIVRLCLALQVEDPGPNPVEEPQIRRTLAAFREAPIRGRALVLDEDEGRAIAGYAFVIAFWSNELAGEVLVIDELYITPAHRGRGHATNLIEEVRDGGAVAVEVEVFPENRRARALYERLGFAPSPTTRLRAKGAMATSPPPASPRRGA